MLTITNYNQQSPNFQACVKMGPSNAATKIGKYLKNKGISPNVASLTSAGAAGIAGTVSMFSPDAVSAPDAAKWGLFGGMASTVGAMGSVGVKNIKEKRSAVETDSVVNENINEAVSEDEPKFDAEAAVEIDGKIVSGNQKGNFKFNDKYGKYELTPKGVEQYREIVSKLVVAENEIQKLESYTSRTTTGDCNLSANRATKEQCLSELALLSYFGELTFEDGRKYKFEDKYNKYKLTNKGVEQYRKIMSNLAVAKYEVRRLEGYNSRTESGNCKLSENKSTRDLCLSELNLLASLGELPA